MFWGPRLHWKTLQKNDLLKNLVGLWHVRLPPYLCLHLLWQGLNHSCCVEKALHETKGEWRSREKGNLDHDIRLLKSPMFCDFVYFCTILFAKDHSICVKVKMKKRNYKVDFSRIIKLHYTLSYTTLFRPVHFLWLIGFPFIYHSICGNKIFRLFLMKIVQPLYWVDHLCFIRWH